MIVLSFFSRVASGIQKILLSFLDSLSRHNYLFYLKKCQESFNKFLSTYSIIDSFGILYNFPILIYFIFNEGYGMMVFADKETATFGRRCRWGASE